MNCPLCDYEMVNTTKAKASPTTQDDEKPYGMVCPRCGLHVTNEMINDKTLLDAAVAKQISVLILQILQADIAIQVICAETGKKQIRQVFDQLPFTAQFEVFKLTGVCNPDSPIKAIFESNKP